MPKWKPDGYPTVTPYVIVKDADAAMKFYAAAFGAVETMRLTSPHGGIVHAEMKIGESPMMLGEENPEWGAKGPRTLGGSPCGFAVYVPDADATFNQAIAAGATVEKPMEDQFWGDRSGSVIDPDGHKWTFCTHVADVSPAEMQTRVDAMFAGMAAGQAA